MKVHVLPSGPIQTNAYLLTEAGSPNAVLIDAPGDIWSKVEPILRSENCSLGALWITHGHWDHTQGAAEVVRATRATVVAHRADRRMIEEPHIQEAYLGPGLRIEPVTVTRWVDSSDRIDGAGESAEIRHVPGHCPGNILFYFPKSGWAFVGDALFRDSIGRTDLPGGSFAQLEHAIRSQIYTLPEETVVYPGHGPSTTVGREKANNPYVVG